MAVFSPWILTLLSPEHASLERAGLAFSERQRWMVVRAGVQVVWSGLGNCCLFGRGRSAGHGVLLGCSRPKWLTRPPECDIFCVFNLISQIRVVSRDALKVFHQQRANFAEPILDRKYISSLIKMLIIVNVHPWHNAREMFDRSDV